MADEGNPYAAIWALRLLAAPDEAARQRLIAAIGGPAAAQILRWSGWLVLVRGDEPVSGIP